MTDHATRFRVKGSDGRLVGDYAPAELHAFKERIREATRTARGVPAGYEFEPPDRRLARETFSIYPLNRDGEVCGAVETWAAEGAIETSHLDALSPP